MLALLLLFSTEAHAVLDLKLRLIPQLNITEEKAFVPKAPPQVDIPVAQPAVAEKRILVSPKPVKIPKITVDKPVPARALVSSGKAAEIPPVPVFPELKPAATVAAEPSLTDLKEISADEYRMIQGLIFLQMRKKYETSFMIFNDLSLSKQFGDEAAFRYAESALELGLNSEYRQKMLSLSPSRKAAAESLLAHSELLETQEISALEDVVKSHGLETAGNGHYFYNLAKFYVTEEDLTSAENLLKQVPAQSPRYADATVLRASLEYRKGNADAAVKTLEQLMPKIESDVKSHARNLAYLTLSRLYFQKGQFKKSYSSYLKIDRSSPLWLNATVEQAWAQILVGDYIGAAGNMFSLHSDFFKKAYVPESYIVRSVGYLNLCQYGDALHVLTDLQRRFTGMHEQLTGLKNSDKNNKIFYEMVKTWFQEPQKAEINSLPRSFVIELANHPSFTAVQSRINRREEQVVRFTRLMSEMGTRERALQQLPKRSVSDEFELAALIKGREALKSRGAGFSARTENEKKQLIDIAENALRVRYSEFTAVLGGLLEQKELLAYEIYSGAGEHLRYQMAGGKIDEREPASLTPEEKNSYKWKFKGEVWEDEIGHYRSSLKNVCAENEKMAKGGP